MKKHELIYRSRDAKPGGRWHIAERVGDRGATRAERLKTRRDRISGLWGGRISQLLALGFEVRDRVRN